MNNTDNLSGKAPWIKNLGGVPAHLGYFQGSMYDKIAQIAVNYPDYIAYDFMGDKERALKSYEERMAWAKKMLVNISKAGFFSSDRTIRQYNEDIWKLQ